jgi:hypothetical protein
MSAALGGWLVIAASLVAGNFANEGKPELPVTAMGFVLFIGGAISLMFIRCPKCSYKFGQTVAGLVFSWGEGQRVNFCPHCGVNLDTRHS